MSSRRQQRLVSVCILTRGFVKYPVNAQSRRYRSLACFVLRLYGHNLAYIRTYLKICRERRMQRLASYVDTPDSHRSYERRVNLLDIGQRQDDLAPITGSVFELAGIAF